MSLLMFVGRRGWFALIALAEVEDLARTREAGANDDFIKPFSPRDQLEHVHGMLEIAA